MGTKNWQMQFYPSLQDLKQIQAVATSMQLQGTGGARDEAVLCPLQFYGFVDIDYFTCPTSSFAKVPF